MEFRTGFGVIVGDTTNGDGKIGSHGEFFGGTVPEPVDAATEADGGSNEADRDTDAAAQPAVFQSSFM